MILVVDDERVFHHQEEQDDEVVYARTAEAALEILASNPEISVLYLDHDLGEDGRGEKIDSRPFVGYLEELSFTQEPYPIGKIFIVTMNHANGGGGDWISAALRRYPNVIRVNPLEVGLVKSS